MKRIVFLLIVGVFVSQILGKPGKFVKDASECFDCHNDKSVIEDAKSPRNSLFVSQKKFKVGLHGKLNCIECHIDADVEDADHPPKLKKADCRSCHKGIVISHKSGAHGKKGPDCTDCHGVHNMWSSKNSKSPTNGSNSPALCVSCHEEGKAVDKSKIHKSAKVKNQDVPQKFSMQIHGDGFFNKGFKNTASCTDCHGAHGVMPAAQAKSKVNPQNIGRTCLTCHERIEQIHTSVQGNWDWSQKGRNAVNCTNCHQPHKSRSNSKSTSGISNENCLSCHQDQDLKKMDEDGETKSLTITQGHLSNSVHKGLSCVQCHSNVDNKKDPLCKGSGPVSCSTCHESQGLVHKNSIHGQSDGSSKSAMCTDCHGTHQIKAAKDPESMVFRSNIPEVCGQCHNGSQVNGDTTNTLAHYQNSVHGKALIESGLTVTAVCTDCHTAHDQRPEKDSLSSIHDDHVAQTCAQCHKGILEKFEMSIHSPAANPNAKNLPSCNDCHTSHDIGRVSKSVFRSEISSHCGDCHEDVQKTFNESFHGKATMLGESRVAQCSDCHGSHNVFAKEDTLSLIHAGNVEKTCSKCHEGATTSFTQYISHADHTDRDKNPVLFYTFWYMMVLILGTFAFFGIHTLLWFIRDTGSFFGRKKKHPVSESGLWVRRFSPYYSFLHICVIVSFMGLAITGMMLKFSSEAWALTLNEWMGGLPVSGFVHRVCAIITFGYFFGHIGEMLIRKKKKKMKTKNMLWGKSSMIPGLQDLKDFWATLKWFLWIGPKPQYGRWTYWEKFDYLADIWGVILFGTTGFVLWFPEFFTHFMPGWMINVSVILHSYEALLATGFIFTIHFFNTHFRPEKFPMDMVIFTGKIPLEVFKEERHREYEEAVANNTLEDMLEGPPSRTLVFAARIFGFSVLTMGIVLVIMIFRSAIPW